MRAIWKGAITFGLVTIPVKLYPATESRDIRLRMLCPTHHAPIQENGHRGNEARGSRGPESLP